MKNELDRELGEISPFMAELKNQLPKKEELPTNSFFQAIENKVFEKKQNNLWKYWTAAAVIGGFVMTFLGMPKKEVGFSEKLAQLELETLIEISKEHITSENDDLLYELVQFEDEVPDYLLDELNNVEFLLIPKS
ncbi:MAG: hypothetical protein RJA52_1212 [Bacteroidota bacterium]